MSNYKVMMAEEIRRAAERLYMVWPRKHGGFVIMSPNTIALLKAQAEFEPLSDYIRDVKPFNGEVGRYDVGGKKIRIVQASTFGGDTDG